MGIELTIVTHLYLMYM